MNWMGWCAYCGDRTEEGDDPQPRLCEMCAKVPGRVEYGAIAGDRTWNLTLSYDRFRQFIGRLR